MANGWWRSGVAALVVVNLALLYFFVVRDGGLPARRNPAASGPAATAQASPGSTAAHEIVLAKRAYVASPFETLKISGTWKQAPANVRTELRVELRRGGAWSAFPLPAVAGPSGEFTVFVELGRFGLHRLRVVAPQRQAVSDTFTVTIL